MNRPNVCTMCEKAGFEGRTCPCYAAAFKEDAKADVRRIKLWEAEHGQP